MKLGIFITLKTPPPHRHTHQVVIKSPPSPASPDLLGGAMPLPLSAWGVSLSETKYPIERGLAMKSLEQATRNATVKACLVENPAQCWGTICLEMRLIIGQTTFLLGRIFNQSQQVVPINEQALDLHPVILQEAQTTSSSGLLIPRNPCEMIKRDRENGVTDKLLAKKTKWSVLSKEWKWVSAAEGS